MFDIDGTLVDSHGFDGDLFARAVRRELGVQVDETWQSYEQRTDSGVLEEVLTQNNVSVHERPQASERVKSCLSASFRITSQGSQRDWRQFPVLQSLSASFARGLKW